MLSKASCAQGTAETPLPICSTRASISQRRASQPPAKWVFDWPRCLNQPQSFIANIGLPGKGSVPRLRPASWNSSTGSGLKFKWTSRWGDGFKIGNPVRFNQESHDAWHIAQNPSSWNLVQEIQLLLKTLKPSIPCKHSANLRHKFYRPS